MKRIYGIALLVSSLLLLSSCKEDPKKEDPTVPTHDLQLNFSLQKGGQPYTMNQVVSFDSVQSVRFDLLLVYLSRIELQRSSGEWLEIADVQFLDFSNSQVTLDLKAPTGSYTALRMGVGLDSTQNASDPNSFPLDHPLSSQNGMYWSWATKYRFIIMEGRANMGALDPNTDALLAWHPGADAFYRNYTFQNSIEVTSGANTPLDFTIDLENVFKGSNGSIDFINENQSHTEPDDYYIAEKFIWNFGEAIELN